MRLFLSPKASRKFSRWSFFCLVNNYLWFCLSASSNVVFSCLNYNLIELLYLFCHCNCNRFTSTVAIVIIDHSASIKNTQRLKEYSPFFKMGVQIYSNSRLFLITKKKKKKYERAKITKATSRCKTQQYNSIVHVVVEFDFFFAKLSLLVSKGSLTDVEKPPPPWFESWMWPPSGTAIDTLYPCYPLEDPIQPIDLEPRAHHIAHWLRTSVRLFVER